MDGTWNVSERLERLTHGRGIEEFEVYVASGKHTPGVNEREVGLLRRYKGKEEKQRGYWYSLNEGVAVGGNLKMLESWVQGRLTNIYVCRKCDVVEVRKKRLDLHDLINHSMYTFVCKKCDFEGSISI